MRGNTYQQLSTEKSRECEKCITEKELLEDLKSMPNDDSPGNDGPTKECSETFWSEVKKTKQKQKQKKNKTVLSCILDSLAKKNSVPHKGKQL